jgi:hypothetical protein
VAEAGQRPDRLTVQAAKKRRVAGTKTCKDRFGLVVDRSQDHNRVHLDRVQKWAEVRTYVLHMCHSRIIVGVALMEVHPSNTERRVCGYLSQTRTIRCRYFRRTVG